MVGTPDENTNNPNAGRITKAKPWGRRMFGRLCLRYMDGVEEDLHRIRICNLKYKSGDRRAWRNILRKTRTHEGVECY